VGVFSADGNRIYIGHTAPFNRCGMYVDTTADVATLATCVFTKDMTYYYWNGTAWTLFYPACLDVPVYSTAHDISTVAPGVCFSPAGNAINNIMQLELVFVPPDDWAQVSVAGSNMYWMYAQYSASVLAGVAQALIVNVGSSYVQATENRIVHVNTFFDREGTPHEFLAYLYGEDGHELRFMLDGTVLTQSEGLQPDTTSQLFSEGTQVTSFYHAPTNRLIGRVAGHAWFYAIFGNGEIYHFSADGVGTGTPYESLTRGLRSVIPVDGFPALRDGRLFNFQGQQGLWSASNVYVDIWPNEFEFIDGGLVDGYGDITGVLSLSGGLVVFKRKGIYVITASGEPDDYFAEPFPSGVGAVGGLCAAGDFALFVAEDGIYAFDGENQRKLSDAIDELFSEGLSSNLAKAVAIYHAPQNQYRLFYPSPSSSVLDCALYVDLSPIMGQSAEGEQRVVSIWPQGKYLNTEYGFQATSIHEDITVTPARTLAGDRYGVLWELDVERHDAGHPVRCRAIQSPMNVGNDGVVVIRQVVATIKNTGRQDWTLELVPDNVPGDAQVVPCEAYWGADAAVVTAAGTVAAGTVAAKSPSLVTTVAPLDCRARNFQVGVRHVVAGDMEWVGFKLTGSVRGRKV